jgi:hypothetical protein
MIPTIAANYPIKSKWVLRERECDPLWLNHFMPLANYHRDTGAQREFSVPSVFPWIIIRIICVRAARYCSTMVPYARTASVTGPFSPTATICRLRMYFFAEAWMFFAVTF